MRQIREAGMKLTLEKPVYGGDCLARAAASEVKSGESKSGKTIFVPLTLPGETVTARIVEEKRGYAKAEAEEILTVSPNRVTPLCPYFGACGGCSYQHTGYATQLELKQQILRDTLTRAKVQIPAETAVLAAEPWAYRNRIRLALLPDGSFGYRARRSHDLVAIDECPIAAPILIQTAQQISGFLANDPRPTPISEIELFTNHDEGQLLVTLFSEKAKDAQPWLNELFRALMPQATGLRLQLADGSFNPQVLAGCGQTSMTYLAASYPYRVDHGAFFQVNRRLIDSFVSLVTAGHTGKLAWDLFAGVGLFARQLAAGFEEVVAVESAPASFAALEQNLAGTSGRAVASTTFDFLCHNRQQREARPDLIVLDPPRAGLGEETTSLLNAIHAPQMVYVSCDPATLARDLHALTEERYSIEKITLADMFPQTFHLETVVHLRRR
ncbi:MAG TPA: 23S rRNA (uracil(1939)-C(5))-methyltransferase RlmD [Acidobacteriaceae bacterium]|nr:23S rRNA (uracil(1939)-C(5))-methyltransferase RlmD [Acidobacteriaceae bacterium]